MLVSHRQLAERLRVKRWRVDLACKVLRIRDKRTKLNGRAKGLSERDCQRIERYLTESAILSVA